MKVVFSLVLYRHSFDSITPLLHSIQKLSSCASQYSFDLAIYNACPHASDDPTPSRVSAILTTPKLIYQYGGNIGFGSANNRNFSSSTPNETFLFIVVNPDICFEPSSLLPLLDWTTSNPRIACASPLILNPCGNVQHSAKHNPTLLSLLLGRLSFLTLIPAFDQYDRWHRHLDSSYTSQRIECTYLSGCFLVIPSYYYRSVGGFNEKYFLHLEDADIVRKLSRHGPCIHNPVGSVTHLWARGSHSSLRQMLHLAYSLFVYSMTWGMRIY
jgi:GT2 family glycosyltransferase